ncbi:SAM-dependent methyltransferase [Microvirga terrestris]|uniref:Class I SAM-dependent methyltransferase n=1 Tax=Microvirga terrestris TaxID=2791024 RepID=A0ABS0HQ85_9HYPH|nr:class I SAM-dependent methyltransferase [Microvirga terrestris]MBF9195365.1 class I SAM-dependent methyltransferase [Microvirga terrestris]
MSSALASFQETARLLYAEASPLVRFMQRGRPYICPMDLLVRQVPAGAQIFDIGCGSGLLSLHLVRTNHIRGSMGVDTSSDAIESARRAAANLSDQLRGRTQFEVVNGTDDWPDSQFDAVMMIDMMHHVPVSIRRTLFLEAAQRVKRGGRLIYKDMRSQPVWRASMNRLHDLVMARQWITYCPSETVREWAGEAGLKLSLHQTYDALWYAHELMSFDR